MQDSEAYDRESKRNSRLLDLFEQHEVLEAARLSRTRGSYDKIYKGAACVQQIDGINVRLARPKKRNLNVQVNSDIAQLLRKGDVLILVAGRHDKKWRIIFVELIGSACGEQDVISGRNPLKAMIESLPRMTH